jgi:hypothetical protein
MLADLAAEGRKTIHRHSRHIARFSAPAAVVKIRSMLDGSAELQGT